MHYPWDENYQRGYEWWLMAEAKKVRRIESAMILRSAGFLEMACARFILFFFFFCKDRTQNFSAKLTRNEK